MKNLTFLKIVAICLAVVLVCSVYCVPRAKALAATTVVVGGAVLTAAMLSVLMTVCFDMGINWSSSGSSSYRDYISARGSTYIAEHPIDSDADISISSFGLSHSFAIPLLVWTWIRDFVSWLIDTDELDNLTTTPTDVYIAGVPFLSTYHSGATHASGFRIPDSAYGNSYFASGSDVVYVVAIGSSRWAPYFFSSSSSASVTYINQYNTVSTLSLDSVSNGWYYTYGNTYGANNLPNYLPLFSSLSDAIGSVSSVSAALPEAGAVVGLPSLTLDESLDYPVTITVPATAELPSDADAEEVIEDVIYSISDAVSDDSIDTVRPEINPTEPDSLIPFFPADGSFAVPWHWFDDLFDAFSPGILFYAAWFTVLPLPFMALIFAPFLALILVGVLSIMRQH